MYGQKLFSIRNLSKNMRMGQSISQRTFVTQTKSMIKMGTPMNKQLFKF